MTDENPPKCTDCSQFMFEVGGIGKTSEIINASGEMVGLYEVKLYQCPEDKNITPQ